MLIALAGLPGTGKSTVALATAKLLKAAYLRVDTIEQAFRSAEVLDVNKGVGPAGYTAAYRLAEDNLRVGLLVLTDSVNPLLVTREGYREVALSCGVPLLEVEIVCSDKASHQDRVETRRADIAGLKLPTWQDVLAREYEEWDRPPLQLDTAILSADQCAHRLVAAVNAKRASSN